MSCYINPMPLTALQRARWHGILRKLRLGQRWAGEVGEAHRGLHDESVAGARMARVRQRRLTMASPVAVASAVFVCTLLPTWSAHCS